MNPHQSAAASHRAAINRQNAAHSTGPATPEGKRRVSLNALRHALTGQTVVLPEDDLAAYQSSCAQFFAELKPQGLLETKTVQTIADTYWRLDRIRAMENNLFSLGFQEQPGRLASAPLAYPQGIDDLQTGKVSFVIGNNDAIIHFRDRGDDHVERVPWPSGCRPVGHQPRPNEAGFLVERENSAGEQRLRALGTREPTLQFLTLFSGRLLQ